MSAEKCFCHFTDKKTGISYQVKDAVARKSINNIDNRVKVSIVDVTHDENTGMFTFTRDDGTIFKLDTLLEKVVTNFTYNDSTQCLELTLEDGTVKSIPMDAFIYDHAVVEANIANLQTQVAGLQTQINELTDTINNLPIPKDIFNGEEFILFNNLPIDEGGFTTTTSYDGTTRYYCSCHANSNNSAGNELLALLSNKSSGEYTCVVDITFTTMANANRTTTMITKLNYIKGSEYPASFTFHNNVALLNRFNNVDNGAVTVQIKENDTYVNVYYPSSQTSSPYGASYDYTLTLKIRELIA